MSTDNKNPLSLKRINIVLDCADAAVMADFYSRLFGWTPSHPPAGGWLGVTSLDGMVMAFQEVENYTPPVWPWQDKKQAQMLHLDLVVEDLDIGVAHALACGARLASEQFYEDSRTFFDPAGHPFCIDTDGFEE